MASRMMAKSPSLIRRRTRGSHQTHQPSLFSVRPKVEFIVPGHERGLIRRAGFSYHLAQVDYYAGCKLGLGIKDHKDKVFISRVDESSPLSKVLVVGDRIVDINGAQVSDKHLARTLLLQSLQTTHAISLAIERPESSEARSSVSIALTTDSQNPSEEMNSDVKDIIKRQKKKMETQSSTPRRPSILRRSEPGQTRHVSLSGRKEVAIASDNEGERLRHVAPLKSQRRSHLKRFFR